jgi:hypothetical protein
MSEPIEFSAVISNYPDSAPSAWADVEAHLTAESATIDEVNRAKQEFASQFQSLITNFQSDIGESASAAAEYVKAGFTLGGSLSHIGGLVSGLSQEPPADFVQTSTGVLIGMAAALAPETAGVGAAVVGVVGVLAKALQMAGFFGNPPSGTEICPGVTVNPKPDWVVGCVPFYGKPVSGALLTTSNGKIPNPQWKRFPRKDRDPDWFKPGYMGSLRKIDAAFNQFKWIEDDEDHWSNSWLASVGIVPNTDNFAKLVAFQNAFSTAWRINCERLINGQTGKANSDTEVLAHVAMSWNRSRLTSANDIVIHQQSLPVLYNKEHVPYFSTLITELQSSGLSQDLVSDANGIGLRIRMGALRTAPKIVKVNINRTAIEKFVASRQAIINASQPKTVKLNINKTAIEKIAASQQPRTLDELYGKTTTKYRKALPFAAGGAVLGAFVAGPLGAAIGGLVGEVIGKAIVK